MQFNTIFEEMRDGRDFDEAGKGNTRREASTEKKLMDNYFISNFLKDNRRNIVPLFHLRPHIISINDQYRKWEVMNDRNFPL